MSTDDMIDVLQQNRNHLERLLDGLEADYNYPEDPETSARLAAAFGGQHDAERYKEAADMTDTERIAWLFEQNAKALAAAAEAASGDATRSATHAAGGLSDVAAALDGGELA